MKRRQVQTSGTATLIMDEAELDSAPSDYETIRVLGAGAFGIVLLVKKDAQLYAMKIFRSSGSRNEDDERARMLLREADVMARINHPGVVRIHQSGSTGASGTPFLITEFVDGVSLRKLILDNIPPANVCVDILSQTCEALEAIHEQGVIHRDVKPENILVTDTFRVKVGDFGVAFAVDDNNKPDLSCVGTPQYMAPEAFPPEHKADELSDIFSLGVVAYELLTGERPFDGETILEIRDSVLMHTPPPIDQLVPTVPASLATTVARMVAKNPADRFPSSRHVADALQCITF